MAAIEAALDAVFEDRALEVFMCIQAPEHCSQLVAHVHGFLCPGLPGLSSPLRVLHRKSPFDNLSNPFVVSQARVRGA